MTFSYYSVIGNACEHGCILIFTSLEIMVEKRSANSGRHTFFMCVLFLMALTAIVMSAIVLKRMLDDDEAADNSISGTPESQHVKSETTRTVPPVTTPEVDYRTDAVVDCFPNNYADMSSANEAECLQRG